MGEKVREKTSNRAAITEFDVIQRVRKNAEATVTITQIREWVSCEMLLMCAKWRRTQPIASALDCFWPTLSRDGIGYTSLIQLERSHIRSEQETWENEGKPNPSETESGKERKKKKELDLCERCSVHISVGITCFASQRHRQKANVFSLFGPDSERAKQTCRVLGF